MLSFLKPRRRLAALSSLFVIGTFVLIACGGDEEAVPTAIPQPSADSVTITLNEENNSGQTGTATLTAKGNQTEIVLSLQPGRLESEAVHIHNGRCGPNLGAVVHPLTNIANGRSVTIVNASLASLRTGAFAINAHQKGNPATYTACGNIPGAGQAMGQTPASGGVPAY